MIYNYHGNEWYYMKITKTFPSPIDISSARRFSMWLKGDPAADGDCLWYIRFFSQNGRVFRYVHGGGLAVDGTWKQVSFDLIDMEIPIPVPPPFISTTFSSIPNLH